jgi:hypothetical protein
MATEAVAWMEQHKETPFYLNYWMFSVHAPFDAKKANIETHRGRIDPKDAQRSPTYAAMIQSMDDAIGTLLDASRPAEASPTTRSSSSPPTTAATCTTKSMAPRPPATARCAAARRRCLKAARACLACCLAGNCCAGQSK